MNCFGIFEVDIGYILDPIPPASITGATFIGYNKINLNFVGMYFHWGENLIKMNILIILKFSKIKNFIIKICSI